MTLITSIPDSAHLALVCEISSFLQMLDVKHFNCVTMNRHTTVGDFITNGNSDASSSYSI